MGIVIITGTSDSVQALAQYLNNAHPVAGALGVLLSRT